MVFKIKELREAKGMTQIELAEAVHVTQGMVSLWEHGRFYPPTAQLPALAAALGVTVKELFDEAEGAAS